MMWVAIIIGLILTFIIFQILRTSSLNKDSGQIEKLNEIINSYNDYSAGNMPELEYHQKILLALINSRNSAHLASMVKQIQSIDEYSKNDLYTTVNELYTWLQSNKV